MKKKIVMYSLLAIVFFLSIFLIYKNLSKSNNNSVKTNENKIDEQYVLDNYNFSINSTLSSNTIYYNVKKEYIGKDKIEDENIQVEIICYYNLLGDVEDDVYKYILSLNSDSTPGQINADGGTIGNYNITYRVVQASGTYKNN